MKRKPSQHTKGEAVQTQTHNRQNIKTTTQTKYDTEKCSELNHYSNIWSLDHVRVELTWTFYNADA